MIAPHPVSPFFTVFEISDPTFEQFSEAYPHSAKPMFKGWLSNKSKCFNDKTGKWKNPLSRLLSMATGIGDEQIDATWINQLISQKVLSAADKRVCSLFIL